MPYTPWIQSLFVPIFGQLKDGSMREITWSKADLHIHTTTSDGLASVPELLAHVASNTDLSVIAITDHDCLSGAVHAARLARSFGLEVVMGEEISTADGHVLALFIHKLIPPGRPIRETLAAIHAQGGLAIAPHPFDPSVPSLGCGAARSIFMDLSFDGVEGFNGGVLWPYREANRVARRIAAQMKLPILGNSDSHSLETVGKGCTWFQGRTASDLYRAIQARAIQWSGEYWNVADYVGLFSRSLHRSGPLSYARSLLSMSGQNESARAVNRI
jgi:predicted metal-dependent phosphoesterase TrpH